MTDENNSIRDELKKLNENINNLANSGKTKEIKINKMPSKSKVKKGWVGILYVQNNGTIRPMKAPVEDSTTMIEGVPRLATPHYMLNYKGIPTIIQPEWSVEPFNPHQNQDEASRDKMLAAGYRLLANRIETGAIKSKKSISGLMIAGIVIAIVVAAYFLFKGKGAAPG